MNIGNIIKFIIKFTKHKTIDQFNRCRLLRRGIAANPVLNGYCGEYEYG